MFHITSSSTAFLELPLEIITEILTHLTPCARDILACAQTCKSINTLVASSTPLQYILALAAYGLRDDSSLDGVSERLALLRDRRAAWRRPSVLESQPHTIALPGQCHAYDFVGGRFAKCISPQPNNLNGEEGLSAEDAGSRHLVLATLPSRDSDSVPQVHEHKTDVPMKDFTLDPSQDLLALLELPISYCAVRIHLRRLSAPELVHPDGALSILEGRLPGRARHCQLEVADDVIALMVYEVTPCVIIFNWRTGIQLIQLGPPMLSDRQALTHFSFVSPRAFILANSSDQAALELYVITEDAPAQPDAPHVAATLRLPPPAPGVLTLLTIHTGPWLARSPPGAAHTPRNEHRIFTLSLHSMDHSGDLRDLIVVVRARAFLNVLSAIAAGEGKKNGAGESSSTPKVWTHEDWLGPHARMLNIPHTSDWERFVHGARLLLRYNGCLLLFDFDVPPCAQDNYKLSSADGSIDENGIAEVSSPGTPAIYQAFPSFTVVDGLFELGPPAKGGAATSARHKNTLVTSLPYGCVCLEIPKMANGLPKPYTGYMLDEERIIGIRSGGTGEVLDVWTV